jgi:hypothetical protein
LLISTEIRVQKVDKRLTRIVGIQVSEVCVRFVEFEEGFVVSLRLRDLCFAVLFYEAQKRRSRPGIAMQAKPDTESFD